MDGNMPTPANEAGASQLCAGVFMPVKLYEVKSQQEEMGQAFKEAGIPVVKNGKPSVKERIGVATYSARERAKARIRAVPSYAKRKLAEEYSRQRAKAPERRQAVVKFLKKQAASGGGRPVDFLGTGSAGFGSGRGKSMGMEDFLGGRPVRKSGKGRKARRSAGFKWF